LATSFNILEVAIGLVVVYLLLSLICSSVNEGLETFLKNRSRQLERGIRELLGDPDGSQVAHLFYNHPLISNLFRGDYDPAAVVRKRIGPGFVYRKNNLPSYIPTANFALALLDLVMPATATSPSGAAATLPGSGDPAPDLSIALRKAALNFPVSAVSQTLVIFIDAAAGDLIRLREAIEGWYDGTMDRVSGWYKRRIQVILFLIALTISSSLNIDSVNIANHLWSDPALRNSLMVVADEYAKGDVYREETRRAPDVGPAPKQIEAQADRIEQNLSRLETLGLPIGWQEPPRGAYRWFLKIAGILASALAATLGAPFWFDVLNRFVVVRSTIKPREKSVDEKSKD
jgi:hypothetical protein